MENNSTQHTARIGNLVYNTINKATYSAVSITVDLEKDKQNVTVAKEKKTTIKEKIYRVYGIALILFSCVLGACASGGNMADENTPAVGAVPVFTPPPVAQIQPYPTAEQGVEQSGSLYNPATGIELYGNSRASRVGDIVMVQIVDSSKGKNSANTKLERTSDNTMGVTVIAGTPVTQTPLFGVSSNRTMEGKASSDRENSITATVAARVMHILPGGILQVEGTRATKVNNETHYVVVKGLVRARDVDSNNSVLSTKLAESTIAYYGKGDLSEQQKQGWGSRLVNAIWPF